VPPPVPLPQESSRLTTPFPSSSTPTRVSNSRPQSLLPA